MGPIPCADLPSIPFLLLNSLKILGRDEIGTPNGQSPLPAN
jgi:hypothetical protein